MRFFVIILMALFTVIPAFGTDLDGKAYLQKGKNELDKGRYDDAIVGLTKAEKEFPALGDYALFWLSDAYHYSGNYKQSLETIRTLLKKYPNSPLIKKSRSREIQDAVRLQEENVQSLYEKYLKEYPEEVEMKYLFAQWLKQNGQPEKARVLFKDIYIDARAFSMMAVQELDASDIGVRDMLKHASNQIRLMNYKTAESVLRAALIKDDGSLKPQILRELGLSLFKQKKYRDAADIYKQAGDRYWEVRSLYRSGDKSKLGNGLELLSSNDKRMSSILFAMAADIRREGRTDEAIALYQAVLDKYSSEEEESLWGIGWTHFLNGEYRKASEIFSLLHLRYGNKKYLYWKTRSLELLGGDAPIDYPEGITRGTDFYSVMLNARAMSRHQSSEGKRPEKFVRPVGGAQALSSQIRKIERVEQLLDLGFNSEALSEMTHISKNTISLEDMFYLCFKFQELGEYRSSVRLAGRVPNPETVHSFLYPLAYKDVIEVLSARYSLDPFLVLAIIREESRFDYEARSPAGAIGLMQLMPNTAFRLDRELKLGIRHSLDLTDVKNNINIGMYYLGALIREFGAYPQAIAAYNAGEQAVRNWIQRGKYKSADEFIEDIPYNETRNYVKRVLTTFFEYKRSYANDPSMISLDLGRM